MVAYEDLDRRGQDAGEPYFDAEEFAIRRNIEETHYWHVHRRRVILSELRAFVPPERCGPLVELGCGIGTVATHLNAHGYRVDYADVFSKALEIAAECARAKIGPAVEARRFIRVDITSGVPREGHEGVLLFDVIEHLPDDEHVLASARDALRGTPNAFVVVTVPAFQFLWSPWDDVERHKRRYTRSELVTLLERVGFDVVRSTYFFAPLFFAATGMKCVRAVRSALAGPTVARRIDDLTESKTIEPLNRVMLAVLSGERKLLPERSLPFGTSILAIGRLR